MKTFEAGTQAMIDADREAGHIGSEDPNWGRYEVMFRAALEVLHKRCGMAIDPILKGET
jgi:hypothetical protein